MNDRPNPGAKIAFIIHYPFQYYVYKDAFKHLSDVAEFIVDMGAFYPRRQPPELLRSTIAVLERHQASYRVLDIETYDTEGALQTFLAPYETLVSVWLRGVMDRKEARQLKRVHMTYGAGKELTTFDLRKRAFDLILAYGEYDHAFYSLITNSTIVGNPKFDDWFQGTLDQEQLSRIKERINPSKKTVLYLPTHSDLCSIEDLADEIKSLCGSYNVVVKLHYYTPREQPHLVELLKHPDVVLLQDDTDLLPLLSLCDIVVSDNSSAIFDAMLADKPIVVTDFHDREYLLSEHWRSREYPRGSAGPLTYPNSIEQRIKRDGTVDTIDDAAKLPHIIEQVIAKDEKKERRRALSRTLFSFQDGMSGKRAADAIRGLLGTPRDLERPFLSHALRYYTRNVYLRHLQAEKSREGRGFMQRLRSLFGRRTS